MNVAPALAPPDVWVTVCAVTDVPLGEGRNVTVHGRRLAVFRTATGVYAVDAVCPHKGGSLADGIVADSCVTCPLHGQRFDLATGAVSGGETAVSAYEVRVEDDALLVCLES